MSGETEKHVSGWTVDTLLSLMNERDRRYGERFAAQEKAVGVALEQTRVRFENVNEWRGTVTDLLNNSMPRREADARADAVSEKIALLQSRLDKIEGRGTGKGELWAALSTVALIVIGALAFFVTRGS